MATLKTTTQPRILNALQDQPMTVGELARVLDTPFYGIESALRQLVATGRVKRYKARPGLTAQRFGVVK